MNKLPLATRVVLGAGVLTIPLVVGEHRYSSVLGGVAPV